MSSAADENPSQAAARRIPVRGRPRSRAIDDAALAAARELLAEVGWDHTTMVAIAERAGVGKPALYRRWPSKTHLVFEAVFGWMNAYAPTADATDLEDWIRRAFAYTLELFAKPEVRAALPGLMAALSDHPDLRNSLWREFGNPGMVLLIEQLHRAGVPEADARREATELMTLIIGASMVTQVFGNAPDVDEIAARLASKISPAV
ncbi:TetR/AcrR family transcriptional regulator [Aldersonia sp. NBC_00410]|uniref:TetR/AcrR family transcriptional regulator n=1 Tax=Aldersonia sp. NBC_00410 TaxID=2975954 RepID=UPI00225814B9|nr:TetR/AcrR family transcriptional regulator [Aldersonia sp. NBC_00410]MCX5043392.1 TetR/AcrR family transcriptional regulator [Aldersonia sp. NBC_00410]